MSTEAQICIGVRSSTPAVPPAGKVCMWVRASDNHLLQIDSNGTVLDLTAMGATQSGGLSDFNLNNPQQDEVLIYNGTAWVNTTLPVSTIIASVLTGNQIASHTSGDGSIVAIFETITSLNLVGNILTYTNEDNSNSTLDLSPFNQASGISNLQTEQITQNVAIIQNETDIVTLQQESTVQNTHIANLNNPHQVTITQALSQDPMTDNLLDIGDFQQIWGGDDVNADEYHRHASLVNPDGDFTSVETTEDGHLNVLNHRVLNVGNPIDNQDAANKLYVDTHANDVDNPHNTTFTQVLAQDPMTSGIDVGDFERLFSDDDNVDDLHVHASLANPDGDSTVLFTTNNNEVVTCASTAYGHTFQVGDRDSNENGSNEKTVGIYGGENINSGIASLGLFESHPTQQTDLGFILRYTGLSTNPSSFGDLQIVGANAGGEDIFLTVDRNTGTFAFAGQNIKNIADPVDAQDAATMSYIDNHANDTNNPHDTQFTQLTDLPATSAANAGAVYYPRVNAAGTGWEFVRTFEQIDQRIDGLINQQNGVYEPHLRVPYDIPEAGDYLMRFDFIYSLNNITQNFEAHLDVNGIDIYPLHIEPKDSGGTGTVLPIIVGGVEGPATADSGTDQFMNNAGSLILTLPAGNNTITLEFTGRGGANLEAAIYRSTFHLKKII